MTRRLDTPIAVPAPPRTRARAQPSVQTVWLSEPIDLRAAVARGVAPGALNAAGGAVQPLDILHRLRRAGTAPPDPEAA